jgi:hypothetical protein
MVFWQPSTSLAASLAAIIAATVVAILTATIVYLLLIFAKTSHKNACEWWKQA